MKMKNNLYLVLFSVLAIILSIINLQYPFIGLSIENPSDESYIIKDVHDFGWAYHHNIQVFDEIIRINNESPSLNKHIQNKNRIEQIETITIKKDNNIINLTIEHDVFLSKQYLFYIFLPFSYFVLNLTLSIFLIRTQGNNKKTNKVILLLMLLSICYISASLSGKEYEIGKLIMYFTFLFSPIVFIHFLYNYFEDTKAWFNKKVLVFLYFLGVLYFLEIVTNIIINHYTSNIILIMFISLIAIILVLFIKGYIQFRNNPKQLTFKWILFSFSLAITPFIALYAIPTVLFGEGIIYAELAVLFIFAIPAVFLYLLSTDQLFYFQFHLNQLGYYFFISLLPAFIITILLIGIVPGNISTLSLIQFFLLIVLTIIFIFYLKSYLDRRLRTKLFVESGHFQASIYRVCELLKKQSTIAGVQQILKRELEGVLDIEKTFYFEIKKNRDETNYPIEMNNSLKRLIAELNFAPLYSGSVIQKKRFFCVVIGEIKDTYIVLIGERKNSIQFNIEQKDWITTLAYYASITIENLSKIEELFGKLETLTNERNVNSNWMSRLFFKLSEKERANLSIDLHDTVLQELLFLNRKIDSDLKYLKEFSYTKIENTMLDVRERVLDSIHLIRETCNELRPPFLIELGIVQALENLFIQVQLRANFTIQFHNENFNDKLDDDHALVIYRIVQELLNNGMKHSQAAQVEITLYQTTNSIVLEYQDDGVGMDEQALNDPDQHMGLYGIRERVHGFNGNVVFKSSLSKGLYVSVKLPIKKTEQILIEIS